MNIKKIFVLIVCLSVVTVSVFADEQGKKKKGNNKKTVESEVKQESKEESADDFIKRMRDDMAAMEIQAQYMSKLRKINQEIRLEYINLKYNEKQRYIQNQEESNELAYRGRVPYSVEKKRDRIVEENRYINENIKKLKMGKDDLSLDAIKYYKGSLPAEFSKEWNETEAKHNEELNKIRSEP